MQLNLIEYDNKTTNVIKFLAIFQCKYVEYVSPECL